MLLCQNGSFARFQCFNFKTNFLENKNFFQKTEVPLFVESTKIENASFPCKTVRCQCQDK